jgi:hypothetical protein
MTNHRLITGVDFVVVPTDVFDEAIAFYGDVLHLRASTATAPVSRQAIFTDPDGNPLVLHHRHAPPKSKPDVV